MISTQSTVLKINDPPKSSAEHSSALKKTQTSREEKLEVERECLN